MKTKAKKYLKDNGFDDIKLYTDIGKFEKYPRLSTVLANFVKHIKNKK